VLWNPLNILLAHACATCSEEATASGGFGGDHRGGSSWADVRMVEVLLLLSPAAARHAEGDHGEEEEGDCCPGEAVSRLSQTGVVACSVKGIASLYCPSTVWGERVRCAQVSLFGISAWDRRGRRRDGFNSYPLAAAAWGKKENSRHETSSKSLEEQGNGGVQAAEVSAKTGAQCEPTEQERKYGEDEGQQVEDPGEAREEIVVIGVEELWGDASLREEVGVMGGVEGEGGNRAAAVIVVAVQHPTQSPISPATRVSGVHPAGVCLEEVDFVFGAGLHAA
jgi:hypothetical protein